MFAGLTTKWTLFVPVLAALVLVFSWGRSVPGLIVALVSVVLIG
ncbi:MAG: ionic transporter y4hA, partial [Nocardia sp.]|nr:ionic transporter y4hA [Nocardia sp.]